MNNIFIDMKDIDDKIIKSIDIMISDAMLKLQFYGEFCLFINFKKSDISTCGVNVDVNGMNFYYNENFVNDLSQEEMNFIMLHEIFHLLWDHKSRIRKCGYDHELSNIVLDMIINDVIKTDIVDKMSYYNKIKEKKLNFADIPKDRITNKSWILHKPKEYVGPLYFEEMYEWLIIEKNKFDNWKKGCKCKESCNCQNCPVSEYLRKIFEQLENKELYFLDVHIPDEVPQEYRKDIIDNIKNSLSKFLTRDIQATLEKISKSKKDYIKDIKMGINELFNDYKQKSITKRNRRSIPGIKGKRKESYSLNVLLDVSASMHGYWEKSLSYIFQNDIKINLILCDTEIKDFITIKNKRDFRNLKIKGMGGTDLNPGIDFILKNRKIRDLNTLILTDGFCSRINVEKLKKCMIISNNKKIDIIGKAKQIILRD